MSARRYCVGCASINRAVAEQLHILTTYPRRPQPSTPPATTEQINHAMALEQRAEAMAEGRSVGWREADRAADLMSGDAR